MKTLKFGEFIKDNLTLTNEKKKMSAAQKANQEKFKAMVADKKKDAEPKEEEEKIEEKPEEKTDKKDCKKDCKKEDKKEDKKPEKKVKKKKSNVEKFSNFTP